MALISGKEVQKGPKQLPANPKMWNMLTMQARTKFNVYPSPAAAHWVHSRYLQLGGKFVDSKKEIDPRFRDYEKEKQDKVKEEQNKKVSKPVGKGQLKGQRHR